MDDEGRRIQTALEEADAAQAEQARLAQRISRSRRDVEVAKRAVESARAKLAEEDDDVAALESLSPTRIWAALRGSREVDLSREQAEQQAASYVVAQATAQLERAVAAQSEEEAALAALGDPVGRRVAAMAAKEAWMVRTEQAGAGELAEISARLGAVHAEQREVAEAATAADETLARLVQAYELLGKARSWSTADTFFDGGFITDAIKYDRMDQAQAALRQCEVLLKRLGKELEDVQLEGIAELGITGLTRTFDVWFDNIFSDWTVRNRIIDAHARTRDAIDLVRGVRRKVAGKAEEVTWELGQLAERRETLLAAR